MTKLVRIYDLESSTASVIQAQSDRKRRGKRERKLLFALTALASLNLLVICGAATFAALIIKH